jgi:hypothetical protein
MTSKVSRLTSSRTHLTTYHQQCPERWQKRYHRSGPVHPQGAGVAGVLSHTEKRCWRRAQSSTTKLLALAILSGLLDADLVVG